MVVRDSKGPRGTVTVGPSAVAFGRSVIDPEAVVASEADEGYISARYQLATVRIRGYRPEA